jgi:hypothetical protein
MYNVIFANAQQVQVVRNFKNTKENLLKTNAAIPVFLNRRPWYQLYRAARAKFYSE